MTSDLPEVGRTECPHRVAEQHRPHGVGAATHDRLRLFARQNFPNFSVMPVRVETVISVVPGFGLLHVASTDQRGDRVVQHALPETNVLQLQPAAAHHDLEITLAPSGAR